MSLHDLPARLARAIRWHRRGLAALATALAVFAGLSALSPAPAPTVPVVVAARDLGAGHTVTTEDLRVARYPSGLAPDGVLMDPGQAVGRVLATAVTSATPVTSATTVSPGLTAGAGELLVPFHVADPTVLSLVQVGDRVTVVASGQDGQAVTLASRVRVAALPQPTPAAGGLTGSSDTKVGLVVVSTDAATARRLAAWSGSQGLSIALG